MPDKAVLRKASAEALEALEDAVAAPIPDVVKIALMSADDGRRGWATALLRSAAASAWAKAAAVERRPPDPPAAAAPPAPTPQPSGPPQPPTPQPPAPPAAPCTHSGDAGTVPPGTVPAVPMPAAPASTRPCAEYLAGLLRQRRLTEDGFAAFRDACDAAGLGGPYKPEDALELDERVAYDIGRMAGPARRGGGRRGDYGGRRRY